MDLAAVMDELGEALRTIAGLTVFPYWVERVVPPAAVVAWPDPLTYDATMRRGADQAELSILVLVGKVDALSARNQLARYADGSGPASVKAAVESHRATAYDTARVASATFGVITVAGVELLGATFTIEITGRGA
jgi:hypothetical protein